MHQCAINTLYSMPTCYFLHCTHFLVATQTKQKLTKFYLTKTYLTSHSDVCIVCHQPVYLYTAPLLGRIKTRKLSYRTDDYTMRPTYECPENFQEFLTMIDN